MRDDIWTKMAALVKKDYLLNTTYKLQFVLNWLNILVSLVFFYFMSRLFEGGIAPQLGEYGGRYFPFVFIGVVLWGYLMVSLRVFAMNVREEQMMGTLEAVLAAPVGSRVFIVSTAIWNFIVGSISTLVYFAFGSLFLGVRLSLASWCLVCLVLFLTVATFSAIGIISAGFVIIFKKGDPVVWLISLFTAFFGGTYFPVAALPKDIQFISSLIPLTYSLRALRHLFLQGAGLRELYPDILVLLLFCVVLLPLGLYFFTRSVRYAKQKGSLAHY